MSALPERLDFSFEPEIVDPGLAEIAKVYKPDFALVYGSGVFKQPGYDESDRVMIDVMMATDDVRAWHQRNLAERPDEYNAMTRFLGRMSPKWLENRNSAAAGFFYAPYTDFEMEGSGKTELLKWGLIDKERLKDDLTKWETLYGAGRLHKPVHVFVDDPEIAEAIEVNRSHALNAALLMLPVGFTEEELYQKIAEISYMGDLRRTLMAWDLDKHHKVVAANPKGFRDIYFAHRQAEKPRLERLRDRNFAQDDNPRTLEDSFYRLPDGVQSKIKRPPNFEDPSAVAQAVQKAIGKIIRGPSFGQPLKGIFSAKAKHIAAYGSDKAKKKQKRIAQSKAA